MAANFANIKASIEEFLDRKCEVAPNPKHGINNPIQENSANSPCLLRIACLGNAERTIQGELLCHLRKRFTAISECSYEDKASIDIVILNAKGNPDIHIELKHYSANQGTTNPLIKSMQNDCTKLKKIPNKICIGLYSSIEETSPALPNINDYYRFLYKYGNNNHKIAIDRFNNQGFRTRLSYRFKAK